MIYVITKAVWCSHLPGTQSNRLSKESVLSPFLKAFKLGKNLLGLFCLRLNIWDWCFGVLFSPCQLPSHLSDSISGSAMTGSVLWATVAG